MRRKDGDKRRVPAEADPLRSLPRVPVPQCQRCLVGQNLVTWALLWQIQGFFRWAVLPFDYLGRSENLYWVSD